MGCDQANDKNLPTLICYFVSEEQKDYCLKLKDSFKYEKPIKYEIRSNRIDPFSIRLKKKIKFMIFRPIILIIQKKKFKKH